MQNAEVFRRRLACIFVMLAPIGLLACSSPEEPREATCERCNIILISLDTLRADRLGFAGYARPVSKAIDAFAENSLIFDDVLTNFTSTKWSFRSSMTGRYPFRVRADFDTSPTLAEVLKAAGYTTVGITGGGYVSSRMGMNRGFDIFHERKKLIGFEENVPIARDWLIGERKSPFFLFLHSYDVHCPYRVREPFQSRWAGKAPSKKMLTMCDPTAKYDDLSDAEFQFVSDLYDGGIAYADDLIAPFLHLVEKQGLLSDTIVVITSDHGESLGERGFVGHGQGEVYDVVASIPLVIRVPGLDSRRVEEPVELVDLMPTLLGLVGVTPPEGARFDGFDLSPALRGDVGASFDSVRLVESGPNRAYSSDVRWRLVKRGNVDEVELYDLEADPEQLVNVAAAHRDVVTRLEAELTVLIGDADARRPPPARERRSRIPQLEEQLKALGYVDDSEE